jgi:hypothetical protein
LTISAIVISAAKMIGVGNDPGHSFLGKAIYHMMKRHRRRASCAQQHPKQIKAYLGIPIEGDPSDKGRPLARRRGQSRLRENTAEVKGQRGLLEMSDHLFNQTR